MKHPALYERAVLVNLVLDLTIRVVEVLIEQRDPIIVLDWLTMDVVLVDLTAPRVTSRAGLNLALRPARSAAMGVSGRRVDLPASSAALIKRDQQSTIRFELAPIALFLRPRHVIRSRSMTRFAGDIDLYV